MLLIFHMLAVDFGRDYGWTGSKCACLMDGKNYRKFVDVAMRFQLAIKMSDFLS